MQIKLKRNSRGIRFVRANQLNQQISKYPCRFRDFIIPPVSEDQAHKSLQRIDDSAIAEFVR